MVTKSSNLRMRIISALILIPAALAIFYVGGWWLTGVIGILGLIMLHEWTTMTEGEAASSLLVLEGIALVAALIMVNLGWPLRAFLFVLISTLLIAIAARLMARQALWAGLGILYVSIPCGAILWLRAAPDGFAWVIWLMVIVWATDIGGYAAGKTIGGPKLAPRVSPNKTWAGLLGGMALAACFSLGLVVFFDLPVSLFIAILYGALLAVWAQIGDLVESGFKRHFGIKDSGSLIPGHGGILDRVDGLVFVAPVVALALATF